MDAPRGAQSSTPVVSTAWVAQHLGDSGVKILDGSWYLPAAGRDPLAEYRAGHLPGSVYCDLDRVSDSKSGLPHMLPTAEAFAEFMRDLGVSDGDLVVVYDGSGTNLSAARWWWMFRVFGHDRVAVMDGGLGKWRAEGRPLEAGAVTPKRGNFTPRMRPGLVRDLEAMRRNLENGVEQVVDARPRGRFEGREPEPRPGIRSGHIPGSLTLPFSTLVSPDGTLLQADDLRAAFTAAGIDLERPVVALCGSGTSACALILGLHLLGHTKNAVYDGSWTEWGRDPGLPVESGY